MIQKGTVAEKKGDLLGVVFERPEACKSCKGCITPHCTKVTVRGDADIGDTVDVRLPDKSMAGASAIAYLIPLLCLVAGLFLGANLHTSLAITMNGDLFSALVGLGSLGVGLLIAYLTDKKLRRREDWQVTVIAVHKEGES